MACRERFKRDAQQAVLVTSTRPGSRDKRKPVCHPGKHQAAATIRASSSLSSTARTSAMR
jgi:hypothetical protein